MKRLFIILTASLSLTSCVVGVDEEGNYSGKTDQRVIDAVLDRLITHTK